MPIHPTRLIVNITKTLLSIHCRGFQKYKNWNSFFHQGAYNIVRGKTHIRKQALQNVQPKDNWSTTVSALCVLLIQRKHSLTEQGNWKEFQLLWDLLRNYLIPKRCRRSNSLRNIFQHTFSFTYHIYCSLSPPQLLWKKRFILFTEVSQEWEWCRAHNSHTVNVCWI